MTKTQPLHTIAQLIALANSGANTPEGETARRRAEIMAARHNIDLAYAESHLESQRQQVPTEATIEVGKAGARGVKDALSLVGAVARSQGCKTFITHNRAAGTRSVILIGFADNIEMAKMLSSHLLLQMTAEGDVYLKTRDKNEISPYTGLPVAGVSARKSFNKAFILAVARRLQDDADQARAAAAAEHSSDENSHAELVLVKRRDRVAQAASEWARAVGARGAYRNSDVIHSAAAYDNGRTAGQNADLGGKRAAQIPA